MFLKKHITFADRASWQEWACKNFSNFRGGCICLSAHARIEFYTFNPWPIENISYHLKCAELLSVRCMFGVDRCNKFKESFQMLSLDAYSTTRLLIIITTNKIRNKFNVQWICLISIFFVCIHLCINVVCLTLFPSPAFAFVWLWSVSRIKCGGCVSERMYECINLNKRSRIEWARFGSAFSCSLALFLSHRKHSWNSRCRDFAEREEYELYGNAEWQRTC